MRDVVSYLRNPEAVQARAGKRQQYGTSSAPAGASGVRTLPWLDDFAFFRRGVARDDPAYPAA